MAAATQSAHPAERAEPVRGHGRGPAAGLPDAADVPVELPSAGLSADRGRPAGPSVPTAAPSTRCGGRRRVYSALMAQSRHPAALRGQPIDRDSSRGPGNGPGPLRYLLSDGVASSGSMSRRSFSSAPRLRSTAARPRLPMSTPQRSVGQQLGHPRAEPGAVAHDLGRAALRAGGGATSSPLELLGPVSTGSAERGRLQQVVAADGRETAADKSHIRRGVEVEQFAQRVEQQHLGLTPHGVRSGCLRAPREGDSLPLQPRSPLRRSGWDDAGRAPAARLDGWRRRRRCASSTASSSTPP